MRADLDDYLITSDEELDKLGIQRRTWYVDTGGLDKEKAEEYVRAFMAELKEKRSTSEPDETK